MRAGAQADGAQSADADGAGAGAAEHQDVGAGLGGWGAWHHSATGGSTAPLQAIAAD